MQINIFNTDLVEEIEPTFDISWEDIKSSYQKLFSESSLEEINIVFVTLEYIQELNKQYREIDAPTDVLSFKISDDEKEGEVYIAPEYIYKTYQASKYEQELLRLIIHGTLHILGYDHTESLNETPQEEMFQLQEKLLLKMIKLCS